MIRIVVMLILLLGQVAYAQTENADRIGENRKSPFIGVQTTDKTPIIMQIGHAEYSIPANYFDFQPDPRCNNKRALLRVLYPEIEPRTKKSIGEFEIVGTKRRAGNILLMVERGINYSPERSIRLTLENSIKWLNEYEQTRSEYGLIYIRSKNYDHTWFDKDIYTDSISTPSLYIECSLPNDVPSPGCDLRIKVKNMTVKANFSRTLLPQWKLIEDNLRNKINGFFVRSIANIKPECTSSFN